MITGIQLSSLRPFLKTSEQVMETLNRLAQIGCTTVQLQWIDPLVQPVQIAQALAASGINSVSVQDFYTEAAAHLDYYLDLCKLTRSTWLCVSRIPEPYRNIQGIPCFARQLEQLYKTLAAEGLKLCFHPTAPDYQVMEGQSLMDRLMQAIQCPLDLCLDLYHIHRSGLSMEDLLCQYRGKVCMVHFKDYVTSSQGLTLVPAGQGEIQWQPAIEACLKTGVPYGFVEQESWTRDPFDCMREALEWLNEQVGMS